jgi:hypothetical protein
MILYLEKIAKYFASDKVQGTINGGNRCIHGEMQFKTLFKRILGRFAKNMKGMKGCTYT